MIFNSVFGWQYVLYNFLFIALSFLFLKTTHMSWLKTTIVVVDVKLRLNVLWLPLVYKRSLQPRILVLLSTLNKKVMIVQLLFLYLYEQISLTILINEIFKYILFRIVFWFIAWSVVWVSFLFHRVKKARF